MVKKPQNKKFKKVRKNISTTLGRLRISDEKDIEIFSSGQMNLSQKNRFAKNFKSRFGRILKYTHHIETGKASLSQSETKSFDLITQTLSQIKEFEQQKIKKVA